MHCRPQTCSMQLAKQAAHVCLQSSHYRARLDDLMQAACKSACSLHTTVCRLLTTVRRLHSAYACTQSVCMLHAACMRSCYITIVTEFSKIMLISIKLLCIIYHGKYKCCNSVSCRPTYEPVAALKCSQTSYTLAYFEINIHILLVSGCCFF